MKLWFLLICGFCPLTLHLPSLIRISDSLGCSLSVLLCLGTGYCIARVVCWLLTNTTRVGVLVPPSIGEIGQVSVPYPSISFPDICWSSLSLGFLLFCPVSVTLTNGLQILGGDRERSHNLCFLKQKFVRRLSEVIH